LRRAPARQRGKIKTDSSFCPEPRAAQIDPSREAALRIDIKMLLPEDDVLLGPVQRPPAADAPLERAANTGADLRMAAPDLVEYKYADTTPVTLRNITGYPWTKNQEEEFE
jgi:hypothetical protein